jgi:hypothetical protein
LNDARPGDTILLQDDAEFVGNFVLPKKTGDAWTFLRSAAPDTALPEAGVRIQPSQAALLARLRSLNSSAALQTAPGDRLLGQKRCIALNAAAVTIRDSYISECKAVGQDSQAIGGWNGPGPYTIENNYLEAAAENFLLGGADPAITNLVADGVTFRRNHLSRPMAWRNPMISTPSNVAASIVPGVSLPPGVPRSFSPCMVSTSGRLRVRRSPPRGRVPSRRQSRASPAPRDPAC